MRLPVLLAATLLANSPALAAERNFSITGFDRIRVDGGYKVTLVTGVAPFAKASGSPRGLDSVEIKVEGRTLVVRPSHSSSWGGYPGESAGPVEIRVGTHQLAAAWVNGDGSLSIDKVRGLSFQSDVQGAGSLEVTRLEADQVRLGLAGAASARLAGKAGKLTAIVRGSSLLQAEGMAVKDLVIAAQGPAVAKAHASASAKVDGSGVASITLTGNPACTVKLTGSASVSGCKSGK